MATKRVTTETELAPDAMLAEDQFAIDDDGNVVVKNEDLANALKSGLTVDDPDTSAIKVGVCVDF